MEVLTFNIGIDLDDVYSKECKVIEEIKQCLYCGIPIDKGNTFCSQKCYDIYDYEWYCSEHN